MGHVNVEAVVVAGERQTDLRPEGNDCVAACVEYLLLLVMERGWATFGNGQLLGFIVGDRPEPMERLALGPNRCRHRCFGALPREVCDRLGVRERDEYLSLRLNLWAGG